MYKVEGRENLVKDPSTGAVVNTDDAAFRAAKMAKKRVMEAKQKERELEYRIQKLESVLDMLMNDKDKIND